MVAIIALVAGGVGVASFKYWQKAQLTTTETNALGIREAVGRWWLENDPSECPGFEELVKSGALDKASRKRDAWGGAWHIQCAEGDVTVSSAGPDRQLDTADDIRAPPT